MTMVPILALVTLVFTGHLASSLKSTGIPLLLPRTLPASLPNKVYAYVEQARAGAYTVQLEYTADCHSAEPCHIGTIEGGVMEPVSGDTSVQLQNGITAKFTDFTCGEWCSEPTLMFHYKGTNYRFSLKGQRLAGLRTAANSLFPELILRDAAVRMRPRDERRVKRDCL